MKTIKEFILEKFKLDLSYNYREINENGGLYDGQLEFASFLCDDFETRLKTIRKNILEIEYNGSELKFNNIFFDTLKITYHIENYRKTIFGESDFLYYESNKEDNKFLKFNYNNDTKKLKLIKIDIYITNKINNEIYDNLRGRICHELNHCYTYYEIISDDLKEDNDVNIVPNEYNSILHKWSNKSYNKIIKDINNKNDIAKRWSSLLIYSLTRYERNAFLAEIDSYLFSRRGKQLKQLDSFEIELSKCPQYNIYVDETYKVLYDIKNKWNNEQKQILVDLYNDIYQTNKDFKKIIYILKSKNDYTIKKLNKNIKTLTLEYKDIKENSVAFEGNLSFYNNLLNDYIEWF